MATAEQVLYVLNGCEQPQLDGLWFCVITAGKRYDHAAGKVDPKCEPNYWPFQRGELIVLNDEYGREPFGEGRKPSKWDVATYQTQDFERARALSELICGNPRLRRGVYAWDGQRWRRPQDQRSHLEWSAEDPESELWTTVDVSPGMR